ncbi:MAG: hypothetical protein QOE70_476 [Chthoniobacter sp.]|nr:hypothetical protein [Chthoniobacter sp.]
MLCPSCRSPLQGAVFPAFWRDDAPGVSRAVRAGEAEATCFFHPQNRAALSCERCGRFVCQVCELTIGSRRLCPACVSAGLAGEKLPEIVPWRFLWADSALLVGLVPLVCGIFAWPLFIVTGLAAIFLALRGWKRPGSLPRGRRRWAAVVGLVAGVLQLVLWAGMILFVSGWHPS